MEAQQQSVPFSPKTPLLAVDLVIYYPAPSIHQMKFVVIERRFPPYGLALPGGFVDVGESVEHAALREAREETSLQVELDRLIGVFSDPKRDPRRHVCSVAYLAHPLHIEAKPVAGDDAKHVSLISYDQAARMTWAFDHASIFMHAISVLDH